MYKKCKTKFSRQRQKEILDSFVDMLNKTPLEKISVTGLCRHCGIPRKAFYRYFESLDDVLLCWSDQISDELSSRINTKELFNKETALQNLIMFFEYWNTNRDTIKIIRKNKLSQNIFMRMTELASTTYDKLSDNIETEQARFQMYMLLPALIATLYLWDDNRYILTPKELAKTTFNMLSKPLL